jgi:hypothetical protein
MDQRASAQGTFVSVQNVIATSPHVSSYFPQLKHQKLLQTQTWSKYTTGEEGMSLHGGVMVVGLGSVLRSPSQQDGGKYHAVRGSPLFIRGEAPCQHLRSR